MQGIDTLISAAWVLPIRPRATVLADHSVAIAGGRIAAIVPTADAVEQFAPVRRVDLPDHVLAPGLINAHAHSAMILLRGAGDDLPLARWLNDRIWPLEQALVSEQFVYDGTRHAAAEMLRAGITCCNDMFFFPTAAAQAFGDMGMRCALGILAMEFATAYASDADDYLRKGLEARDLLRDDARVSFTLAPHAPYTVSDATLARIAVLAEELDLPVHMHVHETAAEIEESMRRHGVRPLARLDRLGLVTERLLAVHAVHLDAEDLALLGRRGARVVHCPTSNLKLACGIAPVSALLRQGVELTLGTDSAASNNRLDLLAEIRLAALLAKGASGDAAVLPAMQALECATIGAARALGLDDRIGSIEPGKCADLIAIDLSGVETQPWHDLASQLVHSAGRECVSHAWVDGNPVLAQRRILHQDAEMDLDPILRATAGWTGRIRRKLADAATG
jgi:5-methylthioadenosine/S-adenosylhomocysteine deaminase